MNSRLSLLKSLKPKDLIKWANNNQLQMLYKENSSNIFNHVPFTLLPSKISKKMFNDTRQLQAVFTLLINEISRDTDFLYETLSPLNDDFINNLLNILKQSKQIDTQLAIIRNDYMYDVNNDIAKQIEINTIASSFGALSTLVTNMHLEMLTKLLNKEQDISLIQSYIDAIPENNTLTGLVDTLAITHNHYLHKENINSKSSTCILFIVQDNETNIKDQLLISDLLWSKYHIKTKRISLHNLHKKVISNKQSSDLTYDNDIISVIYFRAGYTPNDYYNQQTWQNLLLIENSNCIKCPSINLHLAGCKQIQQLLTNKHIVNKYLSKIYAVKDDKKLLDHKQILILTDMLLDMMTNIYQFNTSNIDQLKQQILHSPNNYVLKPQREGGGNNLWSNQLINFLKQASNDDIYKYIAMEKIHTLSDDNILIQYPNIIKATKTVSELGIYSSILETRSNPNTTSKVILNNTFGHLLRTKELGINEGGVASKYAVLDTPVLLLP